MTFKKRKPASTEIVQSLSTKRTNLDTGLSENFKISFVHMDTRQKCASTFRDWQNDKLLSHAMDVLASYCKRPLLEQLSDKFTLYGSFPEPDFTRFKCPTFIPEDAKWARIHVNGKSIIAGHIINETFYVVFLDKHHHFYLTKKEREKFG